MELGLTLGASVEEREKVLNHIKDVGKSFPDTLTQYDIDVIIAPGDSWLSKYSAALGRSLDSHIDQRKNEADNMQADYWRLCRSPMSTSMVDP